MNPFLNRTIKNLGLCLALALLPTALWAAEPVAVVFMPQWTPQSQFAGYYLALEKGFYDDEGINVIIRHTTVSSVKSPSDELVEGEVQIAGLQLMQALEQRAQGKPLVNVLQTSQRCGLVCVGQGPIRRLEDMDSLRIGRWKVGHAEIAHIVEVEKQLDIDWVYFYTGTNLFVYKAIDACLCYTYNELLQLRFALGEIPEENILHFADYGFNYPEDGLYVTEDYYARHRDEIAKFVRASKRGWEYAHAHPDEALELSMKYVDRFKIQTNRYHQKMMLEEVLRNQLEPGDEMPAFRPVDRGIYGEMCEKLLQNGFLAEKVPYDQMIKNSEN